MLTVASELRSVVVHAVGAVCVRNCEVEPPAGPAGPVRVRVTGFPLTAHGDRLRARVVAGGEGVRVTDVRPAVDVEVVEDADLPDVQLALEAAESRVRALRERRQRLDAEVEEIGKLEAVPPTVRRGDPPRPAPVSALLDLAAFVDERVETLYERIGACDDELREARRDTALYRARLKAASDSVRTERAQVSGSAVVTLEHTGDPGRIELALEYHVPGARWAPMYQLRLDEAMTGGTLVMRACVAQRTGEDWAGVRLGLSTADLARATDLPELKSLRLGRRQSAPAHAGWREPPAGLAELFAGYDVIRAARPEPSHPVAAGAADGASHREYRAAYPEVPPAPGDTTEIELPPDFMMASPAPVTAPPPPMQAAGGYGAPPPAPRPPAAAMMRRARTGPGGPPDVGVELAGFAAPADEDAMSPSAKPAPPERPEPRGDLLDYAALELRGADDAEARGRLRPAAHGPGGTALEYGRRADEVAYLALPEHARAPRDAAGSYDYRFDTAAPVEVSADGVWHTIPVCEIEVGLDPEFVCVPALDDAVFGTVVLANASPHALLAGPADVSVAGEFLMTVPLPTLAPGARERVGVGVVESVQVSRNAHMRESTAGLRGGTAVLDHRIEIEAVNHLARPIRLDILERVPVTDDKDVRIEEHAGTPRWVEDTELRDGRHVPGARVWRVELAPGERKNLTGGYEIRIPAAKAVVGGNRRV